MVLEEHVRTSNGTQNKSTGQCIHHGRSSVMAKREALSAATTHSAERHVMSLS